MTQRAYVICQKEYYESGTCYFKGYIPSMKEVSWTGILGRAAIWLHREVAEDQAWELNAIEDGTPWVVEVIEF